MTGNTRKQLSSNFATIGHTFPSLWIGLVAVLIFAGANPASAIVAVDQQTVSNQFNSGLRVQTFVPVGQTFIPTVSWHVGVELLLSMSCSSPALPPWDRAFKLRFGTTSEYGALCQVPSGACGGALVWFRSCGRYLMSVHDQSAPVLVNNSPALATGSFETT